MPSNEEIIRKLYASAEGQGMDVAKFVSNFSDEGYMLDMASGTKFRGQAIGDSIASLASAFPDVHRELLDVYVADNVVVVEIAIRGNAYRGPYPGFRNSGSDGQGNRCPGLRCLSP